MTSGMVLDLHGGGGDAIAPRDSCWIESKLYEQEYWVDMSSWNRENSGEYMRGSLEWLNFVGATAGRRPEASLDISSCGAARNINYCMRAKFESAYRKVIRYSEQGQGPTGEAKGLMTLDFLVRIRVFTGRNGKERARVRARTLISHGCQGFLASVMDTSLESPNIENLSVVREFTNVFPDELPGLPPAREIEFGIELIPVLKLFSRLSILNRRSLLMRSFRSASSGYSKSLSLVILYLQTASLWIHQRLKLSPIMAETYYELRSENFSGLVAAYYTRRLLRYTECIEERSGFLCFDATWEGDRLRFKVQIEHQRASGLLQPLEIPIWKWDEISMDFVTGLPTTQKRHDAIWVVVDRLTKFVISYPFGRTMVFDF
ncbi:putative reverse transcriptase domain-containing protein [Tanacetum coccineum]